MTCNYNKIWQLMIRNNKNKLTIVCLGDVIDKLINFCAIVSLVNHITCYGLNNNQFVFAE